MEYYLRYLPLQKDASLWGAAVTAAGRAEITPGTRYPPPQHPEDHRFSWESGRRLDAFQIILIERGRGTFETKESIEPVEGDMAFVVLPGVWHRYRPDPKVGWTESWVEIRGGVVASLYGTLAMRSRKRHLQVARSPLGMENTLNDVHRLLHQGRTGFDPELSALAIRVLAIWTKAARNPAAALPTARAAGKAEAWMAEHLAEPIDLAVLARQLGMSYIHFRRTFKFHTGLAPWQYLLRMRLARARSLFVDENVTVTDAADRVGFSSAFHLSRAFKTFYGKAPSHWTRDRTAG